MHVNSLFWQPSMLCARQSNNTGVNQFYSKVLKIDWLLAGPILVPIGQFIQSLRVEVVHLHLMSE